MDSEIQMVATQERKDRIRRVRRHELDKIEVYTSDVKEIELDTRVLNKLSRKIGRRKSRR